MTVTYSNDIGHISLARLLLPLMIIWIELFKEGNMVLDGGEGVCGGA